MKYLGEHRLVQAFGGNYWPFEIAALFVSDLNNCLSDVLAKSKLIQLLIHVLHIF